MSSCSDDFCPKAKQINQVFLSEDEEGGQQRIPLAQEFDRGNEHSEKAIALTDKRKEQEAVIDVAQHSRLAFALAAEVKKTKISREEAALEKDMAAVEVVAMKHQKQRNRMILTQVLNSARSEKLDMVQAPGVRADEMQDCHCHCFCSKAKVRDYLTTSKPEEVEEVREGWKQDCQHLFEQMKKKARCSVEEVEGEVVAVLRSIATRDCLVVVLHYSVAVAEI